MKRTSSIILVWLVSSLFVLPSAEPKGDGVGLWMEGTVSNVQLVDAKLRFLLNGKFLLKQYRGTAYSVVEVAGRHGVPVTIRQADPFFAMTSDWKGGAIRKQGALFAILESAAERKLLVKFELTEARLSFERDGAFSVMDGAVVRATDADLR